MDQRSALVDPTDIPLPTPHPTPHPPRNDFAVNSEAHGPEDEEQAYTSGREDLSAQCRSLSLLPPPLSVRRPLRPVYGRFARQIWSNRKEEKVERPFDDSRNDGERSWK